MDDLEDKGLNLYSLVYIEKCMIEAIVPVGPSSSGGNSRAADTGLCQFGGRLQAGADWWTDRL